MKIITQFSFLAFTCQLLIAFNSFASNPSNPSSSVQAKELMHQSKALLFEENKGQLIDANHKTISDVKYYGHSNGVYLYCKPGMISFVFTKPESKTSDQVSEATGSGTVSPFGGGRGRNSLPQPSKISTSRMDLILINANPSVTITASDQQEYYENFYTTGDANHGITNVHTYKTLTYKNIYPKIDMILQTKGQGMEYSFLVHPGGKVSDIKLRWNGDEKEEALENGGIKYYNAIRSMEESEPKSFVEGKSIQSSFIKKGDKYFFNVDRYDKSKDLIIDPALVWGTYFGGDSTEYGNAVEADKFGNVFITGYTRSTGGISTSGAYQISISGSYDVYLAKFSGSGSLSWATYFGGSDGSVGNALNADDSGNIYITGWTGSDSGIATAGAYRTYGGTIFLAKFGGSGNLLWSTYYGGYGDDYGNGLAHDGDGNIFVTGSTASYSGIATSGAYKTYYGGGYVNAFLAKFAKSGNLLWGTYYGGSDFDYSSAISTDGLGNVYITGPTESDTGIATSGAYQTSLAGVTDAFLAKFTNSGNLSWATYYGGSNADQAEGISTDAKGNIFITGFSQGNNGIATSGAYQTFNAAKNGGVNAFLAKFNSLGNLIWGTYYGGTEGVNPNSLCSDDSGNLFITGNTSSPDGIATLNAYQSYFTGSGVAFLAKFGNSGNLIYGTYYGGGYYGYYGTANGVSCDLLGNAYIFGMTISGGIVATSGAFQTLYGGGDDDAFLAKFNVPETSGVKPVSNPYSFNLLIYPNPFSDKTLINFILPQTSHVKISVMDMKGNVLFVPTNKELNSGPNEIEINASETGLSPGTYFVNIMINDQFVSKKIISIRN